jgi:hypothetical protein
LIQHESDKIWMAASGHRTPLRALGTFPDDPSADEESDPALDGILESILGSELMTAPAPQPTAPPPARAVDPESP